MGSDVTNLKVDGGVVNSNLCMQIQADVSDMPINIPEYVETTSIGAAIGAKKYVENVDIESIKAIVKYNVVEPKSTDEHDKLKKMWIDAVSRT